MATNKHVIGAVRIPAPIADDTASSEVKVIAGTGSATTAQDLYGKAAGSPIWYYLQADTQPAYLTIGGSGVAAPTSAAVIGSNQQAIKLEPGQGRQWQFGPSRRYFRVLQAAGGFLRIEKAGVEEP